MRQRAAALTKFVVYKGHEEPKLVRLSVISSIVQKRYHLQLKGSTKSSSGTTAPPWHLRVATPTQVLKDPRRSEQNRPRSYASIRKLLKRNGNVLDNSLRCSYQMLSVPTAPRRA